MTQSFKKELLAFFEHMLQNVSCHGGNWVKKCFNPKVKSLCIFIMVCFQTIVFVTIFWQLCHHHKDFSTSLQWSNEENLLLPNITICNPRLFDKEKVDKLKLSDELLGYIYLPISSHHNQKLWGDMMIDYKKYSKQLSEYNLGPDLLSALSIKCQDFIINCYVGMKGLADCCEKYFNTKPYFNDLGTCFSTKTKETYLGALDSIIITVNMSTDFSKGISQKRYGRGFARNAVGIAVHTQNHGLAAMTQNGIAINRGTINDIKIEKKVVNRRQLLKEYGSFLNREVAGSSAACIEDGGDGDLSQDFGWPAWTKQNCQFYMNSLYWSSCSKMQTAGLENIFYQTEDIVLEQHNLTYVRKVCQTDDMLDFWNQTLIHSLDNYSKKIRSLENVWCVPNCMQEYYEISQATALLENENGEESKENSDLAIIEISYKTSSTTLYKMVPQTFGERISTLGGLMGMIMGASIISVIELLIFYGGLLWFCLNYVLKSCGLKKQTE